MSAPGFLPNWCSFPENWIEEYPYYANEIQFINSFCTGYSQWNWQLFDTLYRSSWIAERVVTCVADDMTDKWRKFQHPDPEVVRIREEFEDDFYIRETINSVIRQARLYGGSTIQPMIRGQVNEDSLAKPFDPSTVKKGDLLSFQVLTKFDYAPLAGWNRDIELSPLLFGDYDYYTLIRIQRLGEAGPLFVPSKEDLGTLPKIHRSWMIKFGGTQLFYYTKTLTGGWDDSILVPLINKFAALEDSFHLLYSYLDLFNIDIFKIPNLVGQLQSNQQQLLQSFIQTKKSMQAAKIKFIDANDTLERQQMNSIQNIVPVFDKQAQYIAGASGIPITKILGSSVGGWSTGDNELTQYYDLIGQKQRQLLGAQLKIIDDIVERHLFGRPMGIRYKFLPKQEMSEKEKIEIGRAKAEMFDIYLQHKVLTPKIVAQNIREDFTGVDQEYIDSMSDEFLDYEDEMAKIEEEDEEAEKVEEESEKPYAEEVEA